MSTPAPDTPRRPDRRVRRGLKALLFPLTAIVLVAGVLEGTGWLLMTRAYPEYEAVRRVLVAHRGEQPVHKQRAVGQPYLLYIPAPGLSACDHNRDGYRGPRVPRARRPGHLRILCAGGSTTYGWAVSEASQAYPAQLQHVLEERTLPPPYKGVEVINAGIPWATSAELLTHFHFKFRYYRPDVVVVNTGGNDAGVVLEPYYHPDYSHCRQPLPTVRPLPAASRWLLRSRLLAFVAIHLFYSDIPSGQPFTRRGAPPTAPWYTDEEWPAPPDADLAFGHNLAALVREANAAGARVLLVPFRRNPHSSRYGPEMNSEIERNERLLRHVARQEQVALASFPANVISKSHWVDPCHLNAAGCREKAEYIAEHVLGLLQDGQPSVPPRRD